MLTEVMTRTTVPLEIFFGGENKFHAQLYLE
jgi:hypothetical protein